MNPNRLVARLARIARLARLASFAVVALALGPPAAAQEVERVGGIGGSADSVAVTGDTIFVNEGGALTVLDATDPTRPARLASIRLVDGSAQGRTVSLHDMALVGTTLHVAAFQDGYHVVDVADPAAPQLLGSYDTPGFAQGLAVAGDTIYVADGSGLVVLDASDPAAIVESGSFGTLDDAGEVAVSGTIAYLAVAAEGVAVLDVSDPAAIRVLARFDTGEAIGLTFDSGLLYVADGAGGLKILDVANPATPAMVGFLDVPGLSVDAFVAGGIAYLATLDQGVEAIDVSIPSAPALLGQFDTPDQASRVVRQGDLVYVADDRAGLRIANWADPAAPAEIGSYDTPDDSSGIALVGTTAYVADRESGLSVLDVSDPASPEWVRTLDTEGRATDVAFAEGLAYVADEGFGLAIFDFRDPAAPVALGTMGVPDAARGVAVEGDRVFLAAGTEGMRVVDVSNPTSPTLVATLGTTGLAFSVTLAGPTAYIADTGGVIVADVSNPDAPAQTGVYDDGDGVARDIAVVGTTLYVADEVAGLLILDASDPANLARLGGYNTPFFAIAIAVDRGIAYVNDGATLLALDVSNPGTPVLLGELPVGVPGAPVGGIAFADGLAYVAAPNAELTIARYVAPPLSNISTRGFVGTGDGAAIGGFIVAGSEARRVVVAGIGPDLENYGVPGFLANPSLALFQGETMLATSDDWMESPDAAEILASGHAPNLAAESAIVAELAPGEYTAILTGVGANEEESTGVGLVQAFDLGPAAGGAERGARLANISTRVLAGRDARQPIAGFIVENGPKRIVVRALGPTLAAAPFNVAGALENPELAILSGSEVLRTNADWAEDIAAATIRELGLAPPDAREAAIGITLETGAYTAIVSGAGGAEGVALVEIYEAD